MDVSSSSQVQCEPESAPAEKAFAGDEVWHRKKSWTKQTYTQLLLQIEFYFSASNLAKDRFMNKLIEEDPCELLSAIYQFMF